ncbi:MAG TPA: hypothetical protein VFI31_27585 [Pirellulales bacterium]|nr:hypothetical protein [Pirellulales bacterium]
MDAVTSKLCERLDELAADYDNWHAPLVDEFSERLAKLSQDGFNPHALESFRKELMEREASLRSEKDTDGAINPALECLCTSYLQCGSATRAEVRAFVAQRESLCTFVLSYAIGLTAQVTSVDDTSKLILALAAMSIENCGCDYRDTLTTLADLYVGAEEIGIDPKPVFEAIAELSTDSPTSGGCESLMEILRHFERCAVVAERRSMGRPYRETK